ncbi:uncharacterized protein LOC132638072 [Lycium barbarum]|uniref:uncharacterized protein LOC132638072 n=1 Tax=Lycium barbarum TaxID=112863 RepID=UPI00293ED39F|nr:uncharacterized protein LOC132638072 [Lycium barbarum]
MPYMGTTESPVSQPLRRGSGRPPKQRSDEALAVSPPEPPSGSNGDAPLRVAATTNAHVPPLGSSSDRPLEVPFNEEKEERETKLKLNPLSRLDEPPTLLVRNLLSSRNDVDYMVNQANITFKYLQGVGANYGSFYKVITGYIEHRFYSQDAEREENMLSLSAWQKNYENAILGANEAERVILRTQGEREKVKEKEEAVKRQIEDLKQVLAHYENEKERLKHDEVKYKEAHEVAKVRMQELGT